MVAMACGVVLAAGCSSGSATGSSAATSSGSGGGGEGGGPFMTAAHPPFPDVPKNDGVELAPPRLVVIVGPTDPDTSQLFAFGDALLQSDWLKAVGKDYGIAEPAGAKALKLTGADVPATMDFDQLRTYVNAVIAANPDAAPDGKTVYLFFYPPGTGAGGCADLGAHGPLATAPYAGKATDALAWAQRCPAPPGMSDLDELTLTASHEVIEAATDAYPPHGYAMPNKQWALAGGETPWAISSWSYFQSGGVEVADLCAGTIVHEGDFAYQRIWSTSAAAKGGDPCVPPLSEPYYSASAPSDWIPVLAGSTAMVPITGWSTAPRAKWSVFVGFGDSWDQGFQPSFEDGTRGTTLDNGRTAMLSITTPLASGAYAVYTLISSESPPDPKTGVIPVPAKGDAWHTWVFGVRTVSATAPVAGCGDGKCDTKGGESCASCPDDCGPCGAVCGAANFVLSCGSAACPSNAGCQKDGTCACDAGYVSAACDGTSCSGTSCAYPSWWCAPTVCGSAGFVTQCGTGKGTCPAGGVCMPENRCACGPGTLATTCAGQPCPSGGCSYPDYGCIACGNPSGPVQCSGYTCPAFSACAPNDACTCLPGYRDVSCDGTPCSPSNPCNGGNWWCYPE